MDRATLGGGCFWCIEAPLGQLAGVESVVSGYAGGHETNPSYEAVCRGTTGHAEVVQVSFDPSVISYEALLKVFFALHDPTTADRQGPDVGSQYRSIVCTHDGSQATTAQAVIDQLEGDVYRGIVTEVEPLQEFYRAEEHHQDYFRKNPNQPYCAVQIPPKMEKVRKQFPDHVDSQTV